MLRTILCAALALCVCGDLALAQNKGKGKSGKANKPIPATIVVVVGTIKTADPASGALTVTNSQGVQQEKTFIVGETTNVVITGADGTTKQSQGKDALKDPVVKEGASVKVTSGADGSVTEVAVGGTYEQPKAPAKKAHKKSHKEKTT